MAVERASAAVLTAWLDDAAADLELAGAAIDLGNRFAATHLFYAAEKIVKAVRLHRGLLATKEHRIAVLIDGNPSGEPRPLPADDVWRDRLSSCDH